MSYEEALADLKEQFDPKKLLDTQDVADALGRSREAMAMLRLRKQFPIARKNGRRVVVSIYDLARFISGEDSAPAPTPAAKPTPPSANAPAPGRNRRPPSLAKALSAFRQSIDRQQLQVEFQNGVFSCLEAIDITASISARI
jgi:hypothetical protein